MNAPDLTPNITLVVDEAPPIAIDLSPGAPVKLVVAARGVQGDPGPGGAASTVPGPAYMGFTYIQAVPLAVWTVLHGLGHYVNPVVIISDGTIVIPSYSQPDDNTVIVTFNGPNTGVLYCS